MSFNPGSKPTSYMRLKQARERLASKAPHSLAPLKFLGVQPTKITVDIEALLADLKPKNTDIISAPPELDATDIYTDIPIRTRDSDLTDKPAINWTYLNPESTNPEMSEPLMDQSALVPLTNSKIKLLTTLIKDIPLNKLNLPQYLYRPDALPDQDTFDLLTIEQQHTILNNAIVTLDYVEGFPALTIGEPLWSRLPFESATAYEAFLIYLDMPTGLRVRNENQARLRREEPDIKYQLARSPRADEDVISSIRQLSKVERLQSTYNIYQIQDLYTLNYWKWRTQAYDLFNAAHESKIREIRLREVEGEHYRKAMHLSSLCTDHLLACFADPAEHGLKPNHVIDLMSKMDQLARLSLGANPTTPEKVNEAQPKNAGVEVILRNIAQHSGQELLHAETSDYTTKNILTDHDSIQQAQELIIRMNTTAQDAHNRNPMQDFD